MSYPLEVNISYKGKIIYGQAQVNEEEFELLKNQDRWDLERYLRQILAELSHGITDQIYLHDAETVRETLRGEVIQEVLEVLAPTATEVTRLIEAVDSLPLITHEPLIGDPDKNHEG